MAARKLLVATIGVAAATFSCSSAASGNCCAPFDTDSDLALDSAHDSTRDVSDSADSALEDSTITETSDADAPSDSSFLDASDAEASGD